MAAYTAIDDPTLFFEPVKYTSNGTAIGSGGLTVTGFSFEPDWLWMKQRNADESNGTYDSVRGVTKSLRFNGNDDEDTRTEGITAFNSNGFTCGSDSRINPSGTHPMIAWGWKESATAGYDIVSYTGNGSARTISHSLSAVPNFIMVKNLGASSDWRVYTEAGGNTKWLQLNDTSVFQTASTMWNDTSPTSSVFSVGTSGGVNTDTVAYIAYLFANKQGFSKFGVYSGNGSADGAFIYLGFRPAWFMVKNTDDTDHWRIWDDQREDYAPGNPNETTINANESGAEYDHTSVSIDFLSNGVKFRTTGDNVSGEDFIYMAFARAPLVNSKGVPNNAV